MPEQYLPLPTPVLGVFLEIVESFDTNHSKYVTLFYRRDISAASEFLWRSPEVSTLAIETLQEIVCRALDNYSLTIDISSDDIYDWEESFYCNSFWHYDRKQLI